MPPLTCGRRCKAPPADVRPSLLSPTHIPHTHTHRVQCRSLAWRAGSPSATCPTAHSTRPPHLSPLSKGDDRCKVVLLQADFGLVDGRQHYGAVLAPELLRRLISLNMLNTISITFKMMSALRMQTKALWMYEAKWKKIDPCDRIPLHAALPACTTKLLPDLFQNLHVTAILVS